MNPGCTTLGIFAIVCGLMMLGASTVGVDLVWQGGVAIGLGVVSLVLARRIAKEEQDDPDDDYDPNSPAEIERGQPILKEVQQILRDFCHETHDIYSGTAYVPFVGQELMIEIVYTWWPTAGQLSILRAIVSYPYDMRPYIARCVFGHFQSRKFRNLVAESGQLDKLNAMKDADEIWDVLFDGRISIQYQNTPEPPIEFTLNFDCAFGAASGIMLRFCNWQITCGGC